MKRATISMIWKSSKNLGYFNFRKELQIHMNAIEKVDAKTLPEGKNVEVAKRSSLR